MRPSVRDGVLWRLCATHTRHGTAPALAVRSSLAFTLHTWLTASVSPVSRATMALVPLETFVDRWHLRLLGELAKSSHSRLFLAESTADVRGQWMMHCEPRLAGRYSIKGPARRRTRSL